MARRGGPVRWLHRLGLSRPQPDEAVALEIEHHVAELADRLVSEGWEPAHARQEAERRFGDARRYGPRMKRIERRRLATEQWVAMCNATRASLRSVARTARRYPGFTAAVVVTLGLGIGANVTMYGILDRLLLRPPAHIVEPDHVRRLMVLRPILFTGEIHPQSALAYPDYEDLKAHSGMSVAAYEYGETTVVDGERTSRARTGLASAELFPLLGVQPLRGRFFTTEESGTGHPISAVLSEEYWRSAFGSDPDILSRTILVDGHRAPILGVAPAGFTGVDLRPIDVWLPLEAARTSDGPDACIRSRTCYWMGAVARLRGGISVEAAEAEATRLHLNGRSEEIERNRYSGTASIMLAPLTEAAGPEPSDESRVARWLAGMSAIVLLIACANVANLMLARGARRRRETIVRLALGAGRRRLVGGAVAESVILALLGGALALALARWGGGLVRSTLLPGVSFPDAAINRYVLLFTAGASVLAGLLAGLPPALAAARHDVGRGMASDSRGNSAARSRVRGVLTVTQAALSVVLLVGAGLFVRSLGELRSLDLGLDTDRLLVADFEFVESDPDPSVRAEAYERAMRRVAALPEVESVAATASPFGMSRALGLRVPGLDSIPRLSGGGPYIFSVTPGYFETAGLTITAGRAIDERDGPDATPVVVVSETMARALWPGEDPMGRCVLVGRDQERCTSVVGVVEDAARNGYRDRPYMAYYLSMPQVDALQLGRALGAPSGIYVRSRGPASDAESAVTASLRAMPPQVRWVRVQTLQERLDPQARSWTLGATMFSVFGLLALALAAVGLYSVLAFDVAQRTRELGIRSALGAERARLLRSVLYQGGRLAILGVAVGLAVAYVAAPRVQDLLFQVSPRDPGVLGAVALTLLAVSIAASLVPGIRATRVDPVAALRME